MANGDFLKEWGPQMLLFGGVGMAGYRTAKELMGIQSLLKDPWTRSRRAKELIDAIETGQEKAFRVGADDVTRQFFPQGLGDGTEGALGVYRQSTAASIIERFGLESAVAEMNPRLVGAGLADISQKEFKQLIGMTPGAMRIAEGRASSLGLSNINLLANNPGLGDLEFFGEGLKARRALGIEGLKETSKGFAGGTVLADSLYGSKGKLKEGFEWLDPKKKLSEINLGKNIKKPETLRRRILQAFEGTATKPSEEIVTELLRVHETVRGLPGVQMKLLKLQTAANDHIISGVRIISNRASKTLDQPFVQKGGAVHHGPYGGRVGIARKRAISPEALADLAAMGPEGVTEARLKEVVVNQDVARLREMTTIAPGESRTLLGNLFGSKAERGYGMLSTLGSIREDIGADILPRVANPGVNIRTANTLSMRGMANAELVKEQLEGTLRGILDPYAGLSPGQATKPLLNVGIGRIPGSLSIGQFVGAPKDLAQSMRPGFFFGEEWGGAGVRGVEQLKSGAVMPEIRAAAIRKNLLESMLGSSGRLASAIHEDEIIAARGLKERSFIYRDSMTVSTSRPTSSELSPKRIKRMGMVQSELHEIADLMESGVKQQEAVRRLSVARLNAVSDSIAGGGIQGFQEALGRENKRLIKMGGSPATIGRGTLRGVTETGGYREALGRVIEAQYRQAGTLGTFGSGTEIGFDSAGKMERLGRGQSFFARSAGISKGELKLEGLLLESPEMGFKSFLFKRTIKDFMPEKEMRHIAAVGEMIEADPAARAKLLSIGEDKALSQAEKMGRIRSELVDPIERVLAEVHEGKIIPGENKVYKSYLRAQESVRGVEALTVEGMTKLGERQLAPMTHSMISELASTHTEIGRQIGLMTDDVLTTGDQYIRQGYNKQGELVEMGKRASTDKFTSPGATKAELIAEQKHIENYMARMGVAPEGEFPSTKWLVDDKIDRQKRWKHNQIARFELAAEAMSAGRYKRWSISQMAHDISQSEDMLGKIGASAGISKAEAKEVMSGGWGTGKWTSEEYRAFRSHLPDEVFREALAKQTAHRTWQMPFAPSRRPEDILGSGRLATFQEQMLAHTQAQGGVVGEMGRELANRSRTDLRASKELARGIAVSQASEIGVKTIPADSRLLGRGVFPSKQDLSSPQSAGLFSQNPTVRAAAATELRSRAGLAATEPIVFQLGDEAAEKFGQKFLYHIEEPFDKLTGGYIKGDMTTMGAYDRATHEALSEVRMGNVEVLGEAGAKYQATLSELGSRKGGALSEAFKGKVSGSMQGQAQSAFTQEALLSLGSEYKHGVGLFEGDIAKMATQMGSDPAEYISAARRGEAAGLVGRYPMTEKLRITNAPIFSMEEAGRRLAAKGFQNIETNVTESVRRGAIPASQAADAIAGRKEAWLRTVDHGALVRLQDTASKTGGRAADLITADTMSQGMLKGLERNRAYIPFGGAAEMSMVSSLGVDTDADQLHVFLTKDKNTRKKAAELARYNAQIVEDWMSQGKSLSAFDDFLSQRQRPAGHDPALYAQAEARASYNIHQAELFSQLKERSSGAPMAEGELLMEGGRHSPAAQRRSEAAAIMARMEKETIGPLTNLTDFTRMYHRRGVANAGQMGAKTAMMGEILLGILPEIALKAKQKGVEGIIQDQRHKHVESIMESLKGAPGGVGQADITRRAAQFKEAFVGLHPGVDKEFMGALFKGGTAEHLIAAAAESGRGGEDVLHRLLRIPKGAEVPETTAQLAEMLSQQGLENRQAALYKGVAEDLGIGAGRADRAIGAKQSLTENVRTVWETFKKHKKPALIGLGAAIGASMLMGSAGHISEEEAMAAGARHGRGSDPSIPPLDGGNSARLTGGNSIRIKAQSLSRIDPRLLTENLNRRYPGSDVTFNINDNGQTINNEYVRKAIQRG